jgi:hypothetical protein
VAWGSTGATIEGSRAPCRGSGPRLVAILVAVARRERGGLPAMLMVRLRVSVVSGTTAQAVAAAQGHALRSLVASLDVPGPADQAETGDAKGSHGPDRRNRVKPAHVYGDPVSPSAHPDAWVCRTCTLLTCLNALMQGDRNKAATLHTAPDQPQ